MSRWEIVQIQNWLKTSACQVETLKFLVVFVTYWLLNCYHSFSGFSNVQQRRSQKKTSSLTFVRQMFQQRTHRKKKKKHRNLQKLSLSSNSTISPRWHHNCLDQRRHHKQPAPVSGGKIFDRTCSTKTKKLSKQRNWGFLGKDILNKNFQLFAGILFLAQFFFLEIHCWLFWFN